MKGPFGRVLASSDRGVVRRRGLGVATQSPQHVGADRMKQVVLTELEPVYEGERSIGAFDLSDRDGAVEGDHGTRRHRQQLVVQLQNLQPVRRGGVWRVAMDSLDCCLNLVRTRPVVPEATPYKSLPFGDQLAIPPAAILIGQQDQVAVQTYPRVS